MTAEERKALNEVTFREANEGIRRTQQKLGIQGVVPFICECDDPECREVVRLTPEAYEAIRAQRTWFLVIEGHPTDGLAVARNNGYIVSEKQARGAEIAWATDPRSEG
jgi:hypothetical protein